MPGVSGSLTASRGAFRPTSQRQRVVAAASLEGDVALAEHRLPGQVPFGDRLAEQVDQLAADREPVIGEPEFGRVALPVPFLLADQPGWGPSPASMASSSRTSISEDSSAAVIR